MADGDGCIALVQQQHRWHAHNVRSAHNHGALALDGDIAPVWMCGWGLQKSDKQSSEVLMQYCVGFRKGMCDGLRVLGKVGVGVVLAIIIVSGATPTHPYPFHYLDVILLLLLLLLLLLRR